MHTDLSPVFMDGRVKPDHDGAEESATPFIPRVMLGPVPSIPRRG